MPDTFQLASEADDAQIGAVHRAAFADEPGGPNEEFLPEARGRGIAAALMTSALEGRPEPRALLGTWQHPSGRMPG